MGLDTIRHEVEMMLTDLDEKLTAAEQRLASGDEMTRVKAAGELSYLRGQKATVQARLAEIDSAPHSASETLVQWIKEEVFDLKLRVEAWFTGAH